MKFLLAFVFFIVAVMTIFSRDGEELLYVGIVTIVGFLLGKVYDLSRQLTELRNALAKDWEARNAIKCIESLAESTDEVSEDQVSQGQASQDSVTSVPESSVKLSTDTLAEQNEDYLDAVNQAASSVESSEPTPTPIKAQASQRDTAWNASTAVPDSETLAQTPHEPGIFDKIASAIKGYFTGGNIFVRIGIVILFFGVSFLLKYVSERGIFPIEYRLIGVVIGAMCLLGLGWRLRHKNETYALLLQGAGIGILYLDIYAAYNLYQLIPALAAFVLLFVVSMFSAALAVMQNSKSLAILGFSGGFLAPILVSTGSNNHVNLFSYYAVLNVAIVAIAWFKSWRELNLLGFAFTFIIGTAWGVLSYNSAKFASTEPFLILFFVFYVLIAVLYALRQPPKLRGYVDGTLLFGVPLAASGLQYYLVKGFEYGVSISSFVMGAFYILLSWFIWKRKGDGLKLLAEAFLALGVIFTSMAIPFALAPTQTAAAWALEGAGFIWLGSRQNRVTVRGFGVLLQIGAGAMFLWGFKYEANAQAFINGEFISSMMLAVAGILSAYLLFKPFKGQKQWEKFVSPALLVWGLVWLVGDVTLQMVRHSSEDLLASSLMVFTSLLSLFFGVIALRIKPIWKHAYVAAFALFAVLLFFGFAQVFLTLFSNTVSYHPSMAYGWLAWPLAFAVYYFLLHKAHKHELFPRFQVFLHTALLLIAVFLVTYEGYWWMVEKLGITSSWLGLWLAVPATITLWKIIKAKFWPFSVHKDSYRRYSGSILAVGLAFWSFLALIDKGTSDPLPWLPVLNPFDVMVIIVFITLFKWWQSREQTKQTNESYVSGFISVNPVLNQRLFVIGFALLGFLWLNFTLFRIAHHWFAVPYTETALYASSLVQTSVSILWAFTGVVLTLFASRKNNRLLWMIGAVLLGLVVLKLFVIDLSALGSLGRVISFLVVGLLLTSIGYFAPLPEKEVDENLEPEHGTVDKDGVDKIDSDKTASYNKNDEKPKDA